MGKFVGKESYIELMDSVLNAYTVEHIERYTKDVEENGILEHGFPRLTANLGILIAHGKRNSLKDLFLRMMNLCCNEILYAKQNGLKRQRWAGNDFSVKEIVFCLLEIEKSGVFEQSVTQKWRNKLAEIDPYDTYNEIAKSCEDNVHNWAAFGAVSEQLRKYAKIGDESKFIETQIGSQMKYFDDNGMYRDPNEPMVYDMVTRLQLALVLYFGFEGECKAALEETLLKSADITLEMQSVTGEIPYGGRSNQFLHNETFYAALCEFYACFFKQKGDMKKAGSFKRAARIAAQSIVPWLEGDKIYHVKNRYPNDSKFGCEDYAYFDKYMVTASSWLYCAYVMADDSIEETDCPMDNQNFIIKTTEHFHKVICKFGEYCFEFDTDADLHYDCSGLGRIHKKGAPSTICMSLPFTATPNYTLDIKNPSNLSICGGVKTEKGFVYGCDKGSKYTLLNKEITEKGAALKFECKNGENVFYEEYTVSEKGVKITVYGGKELKILFPVFEFDGQNRTEVKAENNALEVAYGGFVCRYTTDNTMKFTDTLYANRNGHYKAAAVCGENSISLNVEIKG